MFVTGVQTCALTDLHSFYGALGGPDSDLCAPVCVCVCVCSPLSTDQHILALIHQDRHVVTCGDQINILLVLERKLHCHVLGEGWLGQKAISLQLNPWVSNIKPAKTQVCF